MTLLYAFACNSQKMRKGWNFYVACVRPLQAFKKRTHFELKIDTLQRDLKHNRWAEVLVTESTRLCPPAGEAVCIKKITVCENDFPRTENALAQRPIDRVRGAE